LYRPWQKESGNRRGKPESVGKIYIPKNRDFSQVHIFLQYHKGGYMNLDGLHRLLAWAVFEKTEEIPAYVLGWPEMNSDTATSSV
jgi:hypothetical protein